MREKNLILLLRFLYNAVLCGLNKKNVFNVLGADKRDYVSAKGAAGARFANPGRLRVGIVFQQSPVPSAGKTARACQQGNGGRRRVRGNKNERSNCAFKGTN